MTVARFWTITNSEVVISPPNNPGNGNGGGGNQGGGNGSGGGPGNGNGNPGNGGGGRGKGRGPGGNNSGGGAGGPPVDYSYLGEQPLFVADYTRGWYGHGPGGSTAPSGSSNSTSLFAADDWGTLNSGALARLSAISGSGATCAVSATRVHNTGLQCVYFGALNSATPTADYIRHSYVDDGVVDRHRAEAVSTATPTGRLAFYNETSADLTQKIAFRVKTGNCRVARTPGPLAGNSTGALTVPSGLDDAVIYCGDFPSGTRYRPTSIVTPDYIIVFAEVGWSDVQMNGLVDGTYSPS